MFCHGWAAAKPGAIRRSCVSGPRTSAVRDRLSSRMRCRLDSASGSITAAASSTDQRHVSLASAVRPILLRAVGRIHYVVAVGHPPRRHRCRRHHGLAVVHRGVGKFGVNPRPSAPRSGISSSRTTRQRCGNPARCVAFILGA